MHSSIFILHGIINLALKLGETRAKDLFSESSWLRLASYEATGELPEGEEATLVWPWLRDNLEQNRWETMHEQTELESKVIDFLTVINPSTIDTGPFYAPRS